MVTSAKGGITGYTPPEAGRILANRKPFIKRVSVLGSSLTAHNSEFGSTNVSGSAVAYSNRGYLVWANMLLGGRIQMDTWGVSASGGSTLTEKGYNKAVSGTYSNEILALAPNVAAVNPDCVIIQSGTNDIASLYDFSVTQPNVQATYEYFLNKGIMVIALAEFNRDLSVWAAGSQQRKTWNRLNQWKREYCLRNAHRGIIFCDPNKYITDSLSTGGAPFANMFYDGTHLHPRGAYAAARAIAEVLEQLIPPASPFVFAQDDVYDATYNPRGNLVPNGLFTGTGGTKGTGITGTVADSWNVRRLTGTASAVASIVANPAGGYFQQLVITPSGGAGLEVIYLETSPATGTTTLPTGEWLKGTSKVEIDAGHTCLLGVSQTIQQATNSLVYYSQKTYDTSSLYIAPSADLSLQHVTTTMKVDDIAGGGTAASGKLIARTRIDLSGAGGGSVTVRIGQFGVNVVDDPNLTWSL